MPRLPRIYIKDALNLITCRGEHNETLFKDDKDYTMFLDLMKKYQEQYGIKMFAYCLLPDHLHLLVELEKPDASAAKETAKSHEISGFMRDLNNNYTKYYNSRYGRKGHLFRERFKSALIEKDTHLLKMTAYIHVNPQRLGLVADAKDYPYSTYQTYLFSEKCRDGDLDSLRKAVLEALDFLGTRSYEEFVRGVSPEDGEYIHRKLQHGGILGSEDFVRKVKAEVEAYQAKGLVERSEAGTGDNYRLYLLFGTLFLVLLVTAGGVFLFFFKREQARKSEPPFAAQASAKEPELVNLRETEWDVEMVPMKGGSSATDRLTFAGEKFYLMKTATMGFDNSNYSLSYPVKGRIVFETMQSMRDGGTASWHGEVENGKMTGVLSVHSEGKDPQDFTFSSFVYRRKN